MAEPQVAVASAVFIPEAVELSSIPLGLSKRRPSSLSEESNKRIRMEDGNSHDRGDSIVQTPVIQDRPVEKRKSGQLEERKRGQRLFGALLGTLSQSSSSAAQKRRVDIEKKQQAKLKLQAEEYDEKNKQKLDALLEVRRREQIKYSKQSMQIRHCNLLSAAQFLQTKAEPKLYYKPWELLPGDDAKVKSQIGEAEAVIEQESTQSELRQPDDLVEPLKTKNEAASGSGISLKDNQGTVGPTANERQPTNLFRANDTNSDPLLITDGSITLAASQETSKDHTDDGGEVVLEADEDTVIY